MRKPSQMYPIVEKWLSSPEGKQLFCEQEGLPISVLNYWVSHYNRHKRQKGAKQGFVPLQLSGSPTSPTYLELVFPSGVKLKIHQRVSLEELTVILSKC